MPAQLGLDGIYRGDRYDHIITFVDSAGSSLGDLSGTWRADIRRSNIATDILASFTIDMTDAATGVLVLRLSKEQTAALPPESVWDLEWVDVEKTYLSGKVLVRGQVSR